MLWWVGVKEVYLLIVFLLFWFLCFYGIDVLMWVELMVVYYMVEEMWDLIGVDSFGFLLVGSLIEVINLFNVNGVFNGGLMVVYFIGNYLMLFYDYEEGYCKLLSE